MESLVNPHPVHTQTHTETHMHTRTHIHAPMTPRAGVQVVWGC